MDESRNYALELNNRFAKDLFPNTVGLSVILVIGFLGNILVLFVYSWKMKQNMEARYFIPVLAVFDSLTCAVSCWYLIMDNTYFIHYPWDSLCRSLVFLTGITMTTSVSFLLAIAVQRYLKICRPLGKQMDRLWKRATVVIIIFVNLLYNVPTIFVSGIAEVNGTYFDHNVTTTSCFTGTGVYPLFEQIYYAILSFLVVGNIVVTTCLYVPIGVVIYRQMSNKSKTVNHNYSNASIELSRTSSEMKHTSLGTSNVRDKNTTDINLPTVEKTILSNNFGQRTEEDRMENNNSGATYMSQMSQISLSTSESINATIVKKDRRKSKSQRVNFNVMFLVIVIVYVVSYIPTCAILLVTKSTDNFWWQLSPGELLLYNGISKAYIINHVANPFIFGYFDLKFREHLLDIMCKCRRG